jgi:hypothetical protein
MGSPFADFSQRHNILNLQLSQKKKNLNKDVFIGEVKEKYGSLPGQEVTASLFPCLKKYKDRLCQKSHKE